jgi:hypothetical protein
VNGRHNWYTLDNKATDTHPLLAKTQREALESQLAELKCQLDEYEKLRSGKLKRLTKSSTLSPSKNIRVRLSRKLITFYTLPHYTLYVTRQLHLSPSAVSKLLQRGRKDELAEKLSGALFRVHG